MDDKKQGPADENMRNALRAAAVPSVKTFPKLGKVMIPVDNTWAAYSELVKEDRNQIGYHPINYAHFDSVLTQKFGQQGLYDATHPDFEKFQGLRTNIAVLRDFMLAHYMSNGGLEQGDDAYVARMEGIATAIGDALAHDKWIARPFTTSVSVDVSRVEGIGAAELYKYLLDIQDKKAILQKVVNNFNELLGIPNRVWELPPLEETPFSPANLAAPPPGAKNQPTEEPYDQDTKVRDQEAAAKSTDPLEESLEITETIVATANKLRSVDTLEEIPREESIEEARKILRFLRNMEFTDKNMEEFLDQGTPEAVVAKKQAVSRLVSVFSAHLKHAQHRTPDIARREPSVQHARDTGATLALEVAEHTRRMLPDNHPKEARVDALIDSLPPQCELRVSQSVSRLLDTMELGLERASGKEVEKSAADHLIELGDRIQENAYQLHAVDTMTPPAREESIELAREILERLKHMSFGEKPLEELIESGRPEEKVAFAQAVEELADMYKNLISEVAQTKPEIYQDPLIKQASEAVGGFAHAVKLMAVKELPNSIASAQQISAEAANQPDQWKDLHKNTVNRIIKSAEGGLEKAIDEMAEQEQEQDEDLAQDAIEAALLNADQSKRKKKRRRGDAKPRSSSKKSGKKQRRQAQDLTADDQYLKQGRFAEDSRAAESGNPNKADVKARTGVIDKNETPPPAGLQGLRPEDLAVLQQVGSSLRGMGSIGQQLNTSITNVSLNTAVAPDDKTASQRIVDREQQNNQNPRGGQSGPRV